MPVETRISIEFGRLVSEIISDDSFGQASIRTGISAAYLLQMKRGKVPSEHIIEKFAAGYADRHADLHALRLAAGYDSGAPLDEEKCTLLVREQTVAYLVATNRLSPENARSALSELEDLSRQAPHHQHGPRPNLF